MATTARKTSKTSKSTKATAPTSEATRDWKYLADKPPTDLHVDMAKWITRQTGVKVDPKQAQVVAVLRMVYQRSEANKARESYRPLNEVVVDQRSKHMVQAHVDARTELEKREAAAAAKAQARKDASAARKAKKAAASAA